MSKAYANDLTYVHDRGYDGHAIGAASYMLDTLGAASRRIVELGCGSGITAQVLSDAGHDVLGIDLSADMIRLAKQRAPRARFRVASFVDCDLPACDAVVAFGEVLNYRFDPKHSRRALERVFRRVHAALPIDGTFVFDLAGPGRGDRVPHHRVGEDWACLVEFESDARRARMTRQITTFRRIGRANRWRRDAETHELQLYRSTEIATMLRDLGFRVRVLRRYGEMEFPKHLAGFHARKARA